MQLNWKSPATRKRMQEAIFTLTNPHFPDIKLIDEWEDTSEGALQDFCAEYSFIPWWTGIGIIEAAYLLVETAFENGNIDSDGNVKL
jgi:hypothetical protein